MTLVQVRNRIDCTDNNSFTGPGYNILAAGFSSSPTEITLNALVDAIRDFYTSIAGIYTNGTTITAGERVIVDPDTTKFLSSATPLLVLGTSTNDPLPAQVACVVSWRTTVAARWGRGRTYIGPLQRVALDVAGQITAAQAAALTAAGTTLIADVGALLPDGFLAIHNRVRAGVVQPPNTALEITGCAVNVQPDTMRSRA